MTKNDKLKKILNGLSNTDSGLRGAFASIEKEMTRVANNLRDEAETKTVKEAQKRFKEFKSLVANLQDRIEILKNEFSAEDKKIASDLETKINALKRATSEFRIANGQRLEDLSEEIFSIKREIKTISEKKVIIPDFAKDIQALELELGNMILDLKERDDDNFNEQAKDVDKRIEELNEGLKKLRRDVMANSGGGNANRQINVSSSVMSTRYTDINFIPGSALGISTANDDINRRVDITISGISSSIASAVIGGSNTQLQYNDNGTFGASSTLTWNKNTSILTIGNSGNSSVFSVNAPSSVFSFAGNVGIGITSPTIPLHIRTSDAVGGQIIPLLRLDKSGADSIGDGTSIEFGWATNIGAKIESEVSAADTVDLVFYNRDNGVVAEKMRINGDSMDLENTGNMSLNLQNLSSSIISIVQAGTAATTMGSFSNSPLSFLTNATSKMIISAPGNVGIGTTGPTSLLSVGEKFNINSSGLNTKYNNVATAGWGIPAIYANGRSTAQTAAVGSVSTYTVGAADGSFIVMGNILVTTSSSENFTMTCAYTDESNTARTLTLNFQLLGGTVGTAINSANGSVPYEGIPVRIRAKASTTITLATTGTFTGATYNVEGSITQIS